MLKPSQYKNAIQEKAKALGFMDCGFAKADFLEDEAPRLEKWLKQDFHGEMGYMANHFDKRLDPRKLVPGAKSVISLLFNYYPEKQQPTGTYQIAKYAYGKDYHSVLKKKLKVLFQWMQEEIGAIDGRIFVDSAPVLEKAWAAKAGLGWVGKNSNLLSKKAGSFFLLAEIICDLELPPNAAVTDHCGTCTACIDACPTQAIEQAGVVNGSKCISYFTIELKNEIPEQFKNQYKDWIFGCDICQDVCPWNRFSKPHHEPTFLPQENWMDWTKKEWEEITEDIFDQVFVGSPLKRTKWKGLQKNIQFLKD